MPALVTEDLVLLGRSLGRILASIHAVGFKQAGFFDGTLRVAEPLELGAAELLAYLRQCLIEGDGEKRLGPALTAALMSFVECEGSRLDSWLGRPCLTHADFNPSNILLGPGERWDVAAVLDWEFAFSGSPAFDFGKLLRPPLGQRKGFVRTLAEAYVEAGGYLPADWQAISRLADLYAWADFLNRPNAGTALIRDARRVIRKTIKMD